MYTYVFFPFRVVVLVPLLHYCFYFGGGEGAMGKCAVLAQLRRLCSSLRIRTDSVLILLSGEDESSE